MKSFVLNKLFMDAETVAEQLRRARQNKKIKLDQVAKKLNIDYKYLNALEKGDYGKLPKGVYGRNFLQKYADFLGLDYAEIIIAYESETSARGHCEGKELFAKQVVKNQYFWDAPKIIKNLLIIIIITICFIYLGFRLNKIIVEPDLLITNPADNFITQQAVVEVSGKTEAETETAINSEKILSDINGNFSKIVNLKNGLNIITITSKKKHSKTKTIIKQVFVK